MIGYAITIFLSAFLLFQVQPIVGRFILPWFGGTPAVWTTCMLFFQVFLLVGYAYAHLLVSHTKARTQMIVHLVLLSGSLLFLPIIPAAAWKPTGDEAPTVHILLLLFVTIGGPYLLLSSTGPLLQAWFARCEPNRSPYRLYALSNTGSLLALVSYPFVFEPILRLGSQAYLWSAGYVAFALSCAWCSRRAAATPCRLTDPGYQLTVREVAVRPRPFVVLSWLVMAACASAMLLATTNQICQEVAVVPFLWVLPLALYLISFILCFDSDRWYRRTLFGVLLAILAPLALLVFQHAHAIYLDVQVGVYATTLFVCCMICHGELARSRPNPRHLTLFYLMIAAGGALGGTLVAVLAPQLFQGYWEYYLALGGCCLVLLTAAKREYLLANDSPFSLRNWMMPTAMSLLLIVALGMQARRQDHDTLVTSRNFYGILRVIEKDDPTHGARLSLNHGRIEHGSQFVDPDKRRWPTAYYGPEGGVALALTEHPRRHAGDPQARTLRIGVIGLGAGTLAAYGHTGDEMRFYEINPEVTRLARQHFTFLQDSEAQVEVIHGDGRIGLEREWAAHDPGQFDVLVVDAFSSDAIPMHLLTTQCSELYWQHLQPDGILAINISNRHLDLKPVARNVAEQTDRTPIWIRSYERADLGAAAADWVLITNNQDFLNSAAVKSRLTPWPKNQPSVGWTDDFGSIRHVLTH